MISNVIFSFFSALVIPGNTAAPSTCKKFYVNSSDGYINVRSSPEVKKGNILAALLIGYSVQIVQHSHGWLKINFNFFNSPFSGWVARNQISRGSCDLRPDYSMKLIIPIMNKLGLKAQQGEDLPLDYCIH